MKLTEEIVKTAILGTDKYYPADVAVLGEISVKIASQQSDKEDGFLKTAAVSLLFEEAANSGIEVKGQLQPCSEEKRQIAPDVFSNQVEIALETKDDAILFYLLYLCKKRDIVIGKHLVPMLLNKAISQKKKSALITVVCGETGAWLCSLNPDWQHLQPFKNSENLWETGTIEQRKEFLTQLRNSWPTEATELLKTTISQENASVRADFLALLDTNLSLKDEEFLQQQTADKSQKVRATAYHLLKKMRGSQLNQLFFKTLVENSSIKEERTLLLLKRNLYNLTKHWVCTRICSLQVLKK